MISEVLKMYDMGHVFGIWAVERCVVFVLFCWLFWWWELESHPVMFRKFIARVPTICTAHRDT
jgi:hypothetical protein